MTIDLEVTVNGALYQQQALGRVGAARAAVKTVVTEFPRRVREVAHTWIPMRDGCRLAARIWLAEDAEREPVPALLEYIPYRKNDATAVGDSMRHAYFAGHGYASVRVDLRGSGDSEGILYDEYLPQEQEDALEVIAWLADQPWSTGAVGMFGISWGGFNSLQVAALRPPALKAVISICSTDDRYADDVHYMGGCVLGSDMLSWASTMLAYNARPPDPAVLGECWRELWRERLEQTPPFVEAWLSHQRRDFYWVHGSVCEDYGAIACPVYMVGGWADAYRSAILRFLAGYPGPRKGLIGPWAHTYPEDGLPGPAIGFLQEALRWWDQWLKGIETGIMAEPLLRVWMQGAVEPSPFHAERPGRFVAEPEWPSPRIATRGYALARGRLTREPPATEEELQVRGREACGADAGVWCPYGRATDSPPEQRAEDGLSLCFDSAPLTEPLEILGFPELELEVAADRPLALIAVRLCDLARSGASLLVTRGLLNLSHHESHAEPAPLEPGRRYRVSVRLAAIAHAFAPGHRLRLALSPTYWPWAWPSPEPVTLTVFTGASRLALPVRPPRPEDELVPPFASPECAAPLPFETLRAPAGARTLERDAGGHLRLVWKEDDLGRGRLARDGLEWEAVGTDTFTIVDGHPLSAAVRCEWTIALGRGDWQTRIETESTMSADAGAFRLTNAVDAYEGGVRVFAQTSSRAIPRDLV